MENEEADSLVGKHAHLDGIEYRVVNVRRGGMGLVYLLTRNTGSDIEEPVYKAQLAAKTFFNSDQPNVRAAIKSELRHWLALRHENIVPLLAIGDFNFELAAIMPIAIASVAEQTSEKGPIPVLAAIHILREAARGLHFAWTSQRLLHLDVKPANLLIMREGRGNIVKVSDWGMSSINVDSQPKTAFGGTTVYMAPERFFSESIPSISWDIFSLGITLIALISGQLPFDSREEIPDQLVSGAYLSRAGSLLAEPGLNLSARRAVLYLVHPDPQQRIASYEDFLEVLDVVARNPRFNFPWRKKQPWS